MAEILDSMVETMEIYQSAFPTDVCIIICSTEETYGYLPGKEIDLKIEIKKSMDYYKKSAAAQVLRDGIRIQKEIGPEFLGIAYVVTASPIYENGKLVGAISIAASNKKLDTMKTLTGELFNTVETMSEAADQIAVASNEISDYVQELSSESDSIANYIKNIDQILSLIKRNSMQAKILGLNASIEAARAGQAGKGFAVVSNEVQKMGKDSEQSSIEINKQLEYVRNTIEKLNESIHSIATNTEEHAASVQEIRASFGKIEEMTKYLLNVAKS